MEGVITLVTTSLAHIAAHAMLDINYRQMGKHVSGLELVSDVKQS